MSDVQETGRASRPMRWAGWGITTLFVLFMIFDVGIKFSGLKVVDETQAQLGYPAMLSRPIGLIEGVCLILYVIPRTSVLGAILLTAVMGGAIASHMRVGDPLFSHTLFGVYLGVLLWAGLWLRDAKLREMIPLRKG